MSSDTALRSARSASPGTISDRPRLRDEEIGLGAQRGALVELGRVVLQDDVVGHGVEVGAQREPGHDLPLVLDAPVAPNLPALERFVDAESAHGAALLLRDDVPVLGGASEAE